MKMHYLLLLQPQKFPPNVLDACHSLHQSAEFSPLTQHLCTLEIPVAQTNLSTTSGKCGK